MARRMVNQRYVPANHHGDLPRGSKFQAMDAFLLSSRVERVAMEAAVDIATIAVQMALVEAFDTGRYAASIDVQPIVVTMGVLHKNPRAAAAVTAHGGRPPESTDPESSTAAIVEFGNSRAPGRRILGRAGAPFNSMRSEITQ